MTKHKVPWFSRKRNLPGYLKIERTESLAKVDQSDPRYYYVAIKDGFAIFERPKVDGTYRRSKVLAVHQTEQTTRQRVATMNSIAEGHNRYELLEGKIYDILLNKVVWSGRDSEAKATELNEYERKRLEELR